MTPEERKGQVSDNWAQGDLYEAYMGRWSRMVAQEFLAWLSVARGQKWLDIGCGTGALSEVILRNGSASSIVGIDASEAYLELAREKVQDPRATFHVGSVESLEFADSSFDAVVSGLVLNFLPHKDRAVAEMRRVAVPGGIIAVYVWDYAGEMEFMRYFWDAAVALDPKAVALDEGRRFPLCNPDALMDLFKSAGLQNLETRALNVPTVFRDFEDFWSPFLGGQGPAPGYATSLSAEKRNELREELLGQLPIKDDGSIPLVARAWAVKGQLAR